MANITESPAATHVYSALNEATNLGKTAEIIMTHY